MANINRPRGFVCITPDARTNLYVLDASSTAVLMKNDPVSAAAAGTVVLGSAGDGTKHVGVVQSIYDSNMKPVLAKSASTAGYAVVIDDPDAEFVVQCDTGTSPTSADVFATADFAYTAGSTAIGISAVELDASNIGTGNQCRILRKYDVPDNAWGEHVDVVVVFAEHKYQTSTSTV